MSSNTSNNKNTKNMEEIQAAMQALIAQGRKEGMLQASDLNAQLEKLDLSPEKIEEIYDRLNAMNIQVVSSDLDLEVDSDLDSLDLMDGLGDEVDLSASRRRTWWTRWTWRRNTPWTILCGCT